METFREIIQNGVAEDMKLHLPPDLRKFFDAEFL